jgi:hypothetical protein
MGDEIRLWRVGPEERLITVEQGKLNLESRLEDWLGNDISILDPGLLVIGRGVRAR